MACRVESSTRPAEVGNWFAWAICHCIQPADGFAQMVFNQNLPSGEVTLPPPSSCT